MKAFVYAALLVMSFGALSACQSDDTSKSQHETVQEKTVTDPNGNVISHTEVKSDSSNNNTNGNP